MNPSTEHESPASHSHWHHHRRHEHHGFGFGLLLLTVGGAWLAQEFGLLPTGMRFVDLWPLLIIFLGFMQLRHVRRPGGILAAIVLSAVGAFLLLANLGVVAVHWPAVSPWPVLLVVMGILMLARGGRRRHFRHGHPHHLVEASSTDRLTRTISFGGAEIRVESQNFTGGEIHATMAGVEIDLRRAALAPEGATLEVHAVFSGLEIRVPSEWHVITDVSPTLGGVEDQSRGAPPNSDAPRLRIAGTVLFGGVNVRN